MLYEVFIKNEKNKVVIAKIQPNPFLTAYFELKNGALEPKKVKNLSFNDLFALAGFCFRFINSYREPKFKKIENYDVIYQVEQMRKLKNRAGECLRFAYSLIKRVPRETKVSFKAV